MDVETVCQFLKDAQSSGLRTVLVTVSAVEGSSMRDPGTIMGVAEDGSFSGSLSGGCIENAVVSEALDALKAEAPRAVRFGAGSPYFDIQLPCGGGVDLHFSPLDEQPFAAQCLGALRSRTPFSIRVTPHAVSHETGWNAPRFDPQTGEGVFGHWPACKLEIIGHGASVEALARLAGTMGCEARVLSPDERTLAAVTEAGMSANRLERTDQTDLLRSDAWTAFVFLFHDHDWEIDLMERAFALPHFYIGAMGGRRAHGERVAALRARGLDQGMISAMAAPIGVFHSSRDPQTLALSTLAQVIQAYQSTDFEAALG